MFSQLSAYQVNLPVISSVLFLQPQDVTDPTRCLWNLASNHEANQTGRLFSIVASLKIEATIDLLQYLPSLKIVEMSAQH